VPRPGTLATPPGPSIPLPYYTSGGASLAQRWACQEGLVIDLPCPVETAPVSSNGLIRLAGGGQQVPGTPRGPGERVSPGPLGTVNRVSGKEDGGESVVPARPATARPAARVSNAGPQSRPPAADGSIAGRWSAYSPAGLLASRGPPSLRAARFRQPSAASIPQLPGSKQRRSLSRIRTGQRHQARKKPPAW